ncbi:MAG: DUF3060 domain-containing protein [Myxococcaceae bacterium]|nr:DUF3060 domain-containing protein [Myxococcaceae bacterium]
MSKRIRSAVVAFTVCFAMAAGAQGTVTIGGDGNIQVNKGNKTVTLGGGKIKAQKGDKKAELEGGTIDAQSGSERVQIQGDQIEAQTGDDDDDDSTSATVNVGDGESSDSVIEINGVGRKQTIRCGPKSRVEINGTSHRLTLTGECEHVAVHGTSNKVKVEAAATIEVHGTNNAVTWERGVGAEKPKVSRSGLNNKVSQKK